VFKRIERVGGRRLTKLHTAGLSGHLWLISAVVVAQLGIHAAAAQTPTIADLQAQRGRNIACMRQLNSILSRIPPDQQLTWRLQADHQQAWRDCLAGGVAPPLPSAPRSIVGLGRPGDWQIGVLLENEGRYPEAAELYQRILNNEGAPDGDGTMAGRRLAFLYAHGRGVQKDVAKADSLLRARENSMTEIDRILLQANLLPDRPEDVTQALVDRAHAIAAEQQRQAAEEAVRAAAEESRRIEAWRAAHPQEAHAQAVQACQAGCQRGYESCTSQKNMDMTGLFNGTFRTPNYNCGPKAQACLRGCD
jgi:hypothetical protein